MSPPKLCTPNLRSKPGEVMYVYAEVDGEEDEILVFRGFSSSMMRPTASDLDVPVLPEEGVVAKVDLCVGPFNPANIEYIQQGMTWEEVEELLKGAGL
mmetsp:Transcript_68480/g.216742  ORF Transcript_68480/g.216742 Transcript_68480/m.216742 type:complete len:98 (+) Transcript_68480:788-1081(+)